MNTPFAPIALFIYNRPKHTEQVLNSLALNEEAKDSILYVFCDGPKGDANEETLQNIKDARALARSEKRFKQIIIKESDQNKGLADSIVEGVTEVVNKHGKIVVLEDDLVLSKGFLKFMNEALRLYEGDEKVMHISGYMFPVQETLPTTFFYRQASCWGWATWANRWSKFERSASKLYKALEQTGKIKNADIDGTNQFIHQLEANVNGSIKTWAVLWHFSVFLMDGLCLHPGKSLVRNIGMDSSGTHCNKTNAFDVQLADYVKVDRISIEENKMTFQYLKNFYDRNNTKKQNKVNLWSLTKRIAKPFVPKRLWEKVKLSTNAEYRLLKEEEERIANLSRYTETELTLFDKRIKIPDIASYQFMRKELFELEIYKFKSKNTEPYIVDCGANIGLSVIYFKRLFPNSKIIAFEPDDNIFRILKYNMEAFGIKDVELIKKACWNEETTLEFFSEGADGGRTAQGYDTTNIIKVDTIRLRSFLNRHVDFLKLDIEGAENEVIPDIEDSLKNVANVFVEYHSFIGQEQKLPEILSILKKAGFRLHISAPGLVSMNPFIQLRMYANMDNQLNIFGIREGTI